MKFALATTPKSCPQQISILRRTHIISLRKVCRHLQFLMYWQHFSIRKPYMDTIWKPAILTTIPPVLQMWTTFENDFLVINPSHSGTD